MNAHEAKVYVESFYPDAYTVQVASIVRVRYQIFGGGRYWGQSQKSIERAWLSAANDIKSLQQSPSTFTHENDCPCFGDSIEHSVDCKNCTCESNPRYKSSLRSGSWHHGRAGVSR